MDNEKKMIVKKFKFAKMYQSVNVKINMHQKDSYRYTEKTKSECEYPQNPNIEHPLFLSTQICLK